MTARLSAILAFVLAVAFPAIGQESEAIVRVVPFDEAVDLALQADVVARGLVLQDRALDADAALVRGQRRPALDLSLSPSQGYGLGFDQTTGQAVTQGRTGLSVGGVGRIVLYDGGRTRAELAALSGTRAVLDLSGQDARRRTALVVAGLYTRVLVDQGLVDLALADSAAQGELLFQVRAFVRAGVRPPSDTLAQRSSVAGARRTLAAVRQALQVDQTELARALGLPVGTVVVPVPPAAHSDLSAISGAGRPDVAAAEARVLAARLAVTAAGRDRAPSVSVGMYVGTDFSSLQTRPDALGGPETVPLFSQLSSNRNASAFATVSVPLLDGRATSAREARARIEVSQAELVAEAARLDAAAEGSRARAQLEGASERLAAAEEQAELAEAYADVQLRRYQLAAGSLFEWSDARARYVAAAAAAEEAKHLLWLARVEADLTASRRSP